MITITSYNLNIAPKAIKYIVSLILALSTIIAIAPIFIFSVLAAELKTYGDLGYRDDGKTITITYYDGKATTVIIPESIDGKPVVEIGEDAFYGCAKLTDIVIPDSVTTINSYAFGYCSSLTDVSIPDSVAAIGTGVFTHCDNLTSINIPETVTTMGNYIFNNCYRLTSINVASNNPNYTSINGVLYNKRLTELLEYPFGRKDGLTVPNGVISIGTGAFMGGNNLTHVNVPESLVAMDENVFSACYMLTSINVAPDNPSYSSIDGVLYNKSETVLIQYPKGRNGSLTVPGSVTSISDYALASSQSLLSVNIPKSVVILPEQLFSGCDALTSISIAPDHLRYSSVDGVLYNKNVTTLIQYPLGRKGGLTVPNGVTAINDYALSGCKGLSSVTLPNSLLTIGNNAFGGCIGLSSIIFPDSLTSIGHSSFYRCTSLSQVIIPKSVKKIEPRAFQKCGGLFDVFFESETPPCVDYYTFFEIGKDARALVPIGATEYGKAGSLWNHLIVTPSEEPPKLSPLSAPTVFLNGDELTFDVYPRVHNGRVLVPLRAIFEAVGATVEWNNTTKTATAKKGNTTIVLISGEDTARINGQPVALDQPGIVVSGRTLAPLRFVGEAFGGNVRWDETSKTVYITIGL